MKTSIGKNTLGSGKKMDVYLHEYNRSTHDLGFVWRNTQAPGTLVPSLKMLVLPGDTFDCKTRCHTLTHPTVGPLFGSFKQQNDFFFIPIRLYNAMLHNNALNIGLDMKKVKIPKIQIKTKAEDTTKTKTGSNETLNNTIDPSSLLAYIGRRSAFGKEQTYENNINAIPILGYYDIFKNYYANKQEEKFYTQGDAKLMNRLASTSIGQWGIIQYSYTDSDDIESAEFNTETASVSPNAEGRSLAFAWKPGAWNNATDSEILNSIKIKVELYVTRTATTFYVEGTLYELARWTPGLFPVTVEVKTLNANATNNTTGLQLKWVRLPRAGSYTDQTVAKIVEANWIGDTYYQYNLEDLDTLREWILAQGRNQIILTNENGPIKLLKDLVERDANDELNTSHPMMGLCLKTYQNDVFNNWVNTEWLDGDNGINAITAVDTSSGEFTMDTLNLAKKVYDMLNRIATSDGSYNSWIQTVYTSGGLNHIETPLYLGGSSLEIEFQEVISNSATEDQPLGSLAGRGVAQNHKGGNIHFKPDEPGYIMCITSLTPRVDYFQGNDWDLELNTLDDLHKPALDGIGFQDRVYWTINSQIPTSEGRLQSIGKQPAWIDYMTNFNKTFGNFALVENEGWMCLNRIYGNIDTYTTYIFPHLYNNIFADTDKNAMNFWVQIGFDITMRRVMSAKQIPNF